jgi:peptide/nickel transport system ATP-binding protein
MLVTHDLGLAAEFCDRITVMYAGRIVEQGVVDEIVDRPQHPYTQGLLDCRPSVGERGKSIRPISGNVPNLAELPPGCAFAPRCDHVQEVCREASIPMFETTSDHLSRCLKISDYRRKPDWDWDTVIKRERGE